MNEQFRINSEAVQTWLDSEDRKQSFLIRRLGVSQSTVTNILAGDVPKDKTLKALARLMGVEVSSLLLPKEAKRAG